MKRCLSARILSLVLCLTLSSVIFARVAGVEPVITPGVKIQANGHDLKVDGIAVSTFVVDWNNDGKKDLLVGTYSPVPAVYLFLNIGTDSSPVFGEGTKLEAVGDPPAIIGADPFVVDWNNDGKKDLLLGTTYYVLLYVNVGTDSSPWFTSPSIIINMTETPGGFGAKPFVVDWNNDGKKDLLVGHGGWRDHAYIDLYINVGTDVSPSFGVATHIQAAGQDICQSYSSSPFITDWDEDGKKDLIVRETLQFTLYKNIGTDALPVFGEGVAIQVNGQDLYVYCGDGSSVFSVTDWNNDGVKDLVIGDYYGYVFLYLGHAEAFNQLVGYWKFDEGSGLVASDSSGNGNSGTLMNGPEWVAGISGSGLSFDGVDDYVEVPDTTDFTFNQPLTVSAWLFLDDVSDGGIIGQWGYGGLTGDAFMLSLDGAHLRGTLPIPGLYHLYSKSMIKTSEWTYAAMTYDGSTLKLYINGKLDASGSISVDPVASSQTVKIGLEDIIFGQKHYLDGIIDEVKIYNHVRTAEEIWNDYSRTPAALELYTSTGDGVARIFSNGSRQIFEHIKSGYSLEILGDELYVNQYSGCISVYTIEGVFLRNIAIPSSVTYFITFVVLPDERIALLDNQYDKVYFLDSSGNFITSVNILDVPDDHLQNVDGVVVNNELILSEDGNNHILQIDLTTYQKTVFKDLGEIPSWLGAITYSNGYYYVCGPSSIYKFSEDSGATKVAEIPDYNIVGIVVVNDYAYVSVNFGGKIYKSDLESGISEVFTSGLNYPKDLEVYNLLMLPGKDVPTGAPDFFPSVFTKLNIPTGQFALQALAIWTNYENTNAYWNPLATTWDMGEKSWNFNEAGVKNYVDKETGIQATANTLALQYYESIREMLAIQSFNEQHLREAVATWSGLNPNDPYVVNLVNEWHNIYPKNQPPVASFTHSPESPFYSGDLVSFDSSSSDDPDGTIVSYRWDFGDGMTAEGKIVSHRFRGAQNEPKTCTVTLTVEDNYGVIATDTAFVTVKPLRKLVDVGPGYFGVSCWMEATYNWVGTDEATGENLYIISKIETYSGGISGAYQLFILRRTSPPPSIPKLVWYIPLPTAPILRTYVTPFTPSVWQKLWGEPAEITTLTFQEGTFQGIGVTDTSLMVMVATGTETGITLYYDAGITKFDPSSPVVHLKLEELKELWELRDIIDLLNKIIGIIGSPGEVRIYDSVGHVTGLVNGEIKEEIPGSAYANGTILILFPNETYRYEVVGIDEGTYELLIISVEDVDATTFNATEIPTSSNAIHQYTIDWSALSRGEEGVTVQIDSNGDGTFEKTFTAGSELTRDEFMRQVFPLEAFPMWIAGVAVAAIVIVTITIAVFWRKRKQPSIKKIS